MARALPLVRSQMVRIKTFPSRFDEMWNDALTSLSTLQTDMHNASTLIRQTRSHKKTVQKEKLHMEFVTACNTVADDMEARFGTSDHDVIAQGLQALVPGSDTLLDPQSVVPFAKLFRVTTKESLLTAQLLTARNMIDQNEPPIHSLMDLGDYLLSLPMAFTLILECIAVAITIPVSSCSAERCFSAVKRILTRLRTTMSDERLSDLTMLSTHRYDFFYFIFSISLTHPL
jgi:phosphotransferase system IIB component